MMVIGSTVISRSNTPQRRYLTILFCDIVGYTQLSERLDPEELRELQLRYQQLVLEVMERYGGFVAQFTGDGVLIYFGYPTAHENDAERAVRASLELNYRLVEFNAILRDQQMPLITIRVGIHTGLIVIGSELASGGARDHSIVGEAANLAARLQANAPDNSIVVSGETFELISGLFEFEFMGPTNFKGITRSVRVYRILRTRYGTGRTYSERENMTRFVGRDDTLVSLLELWRQAQKNGDCRKVLITGDAGVGKTRLVFELIKHAQLAHANVMQLHCHEMFSNTPLYCIEICIWAQAGLAVDDDKATRAKKLESFLKELDLSSDENSFMINNLLGGPTPLIAEGSGPSPLLLKQKQNALLVSIFDQLIRDKPTLFWVDDVHWIDPSSAEVVKEIVNRLSGKKILVVLTGRSHPINLNPPWADEAIHLLQLPKENCIELARSIHGIQDLSADELALGIEAADGIPLFIEYLVRSLVDQKRFPPSPSRKRDLPLTLAAMMSERLDRVADGRKIVQAAACIGRAFSADFLAAVLGHHVDGITRTLDALVNSEILLRNFENRDMRFEFRHALLRRAAYESIIQSERRTIHGGIVKELTQRYSKEQIVPELLAYHLTGAGKFDEATQAWLAAGANAARRSAHLEAIEHIRSGLKLLPEIRASDLRRSLELSLQASLIGSLTASEGPTSKALSECCRRGLELCKEGEASSLAFAFLFGEFTFAMCRGEVREAESLAKLFLSLATQKSYDSGRVIGHRLMGMMQLEQGRAREAKEHLELSLSLYSAPRDETSTHMFGQNTQVHSRSLLSLANFCLGEIDLSLQMGIDALKAADALRHPHSTALALGYVGGWVFGLCGAASEMMQEARKLITIAEQHRLGPFRLFGLAFMGWAYCQQQNLDRGITMLREAIAGLESIEFQLSISGHLAMLADAQRRQGNFHDALKWCARALQLVRSGKDRWLESEVLRVDACIASDKGLDSDVVETKFRDAIASARSLVFPVFELRALVDINEYLEANGRQDLEVKRRMSELAHLQHLDRKVASALR